MTSTAAAPIYHLLKLSVTSDGGDYGATSCDQDFGIVRALSKCLVNDGHYNHEGDFNASLEWFPFETKKDLETAYKLQHSCNEDGDEESQKHDDFFAFYHVKDAQGKETIFDENWKAIDLTKEDKDDSEGDEGEEEGED